MNATRPAVKSAHAKQIPRKVRSTMSWRPLGARAISPGDEPKRAPAGSSACGAAAPPSITRIASRLLRGQVLNRAAGFLGDARRQRDVAEGLRVLLPFGQPEAQQVLHRLQFLFVGVLLVADQPGVGDNRIR